MKLYEFQGKELFRKYGIPVPDGYVITSAEQVKEVEGEVVVKSQVLVGGRGKAGGIKFAKSREEAIEIARQLLGSELKGTKINYLLIEEKLNIEKEYYLSITIDRSRRCPIIMASAEGGVEIEEVPDELIYKYWIDPLAGIYPFVARNLAKKLGFAGDTAKQFIKILLSLYKLFVEYDAELVEINPLVLTKEGKLVAADSKVIVDSDAEYRHPDLPKNVEDMTPLEKYASERGYAFVELDGDIGVIANGAGLTMATLDALLLHNLRPKTFLDLGGTDSVEKTKNAFEIVLKANPKVIFVNIFGGVTKCSTVAKGILAAKEEFNINVPMVVRLSGVHEEEGRKMLRDAGIEAFGEMMPAVEKVAEIYREVMK